MSQDSRPPNIIGPLNIYSLLAIAGIIGPVVFIITNLVIIFSSPGYDILHNTLSSLAWTPLGWLQSIGFLAVGLLVEVFTVGLLFSVRGKRGFGTGIVLLVFLGFGLLLVGAFQEDLNDVARTIHGVIHTTAAATVFTIFPIASLLIALSLRKDPYWKGLFVYTIVATVLAFGFVAVHFGLLPKQDWIGLYEQIMVANMVIWIEVMAIQLLRMSLRPEGKFRRPKIF
jgi:hypothetical membrane protein